MLSLTDLSETLVLIAMAGTVVLLLMSLMQGAGDRLLRALVVVAALVALPYAPSALAADDHDEQVHFATSSGLHFYAGSEVEVSGFAEDLFAAGGEVDVESLTSSVMVVAGGDVSANNIETDRAILAGGNVEVGGIINRHLIAAGGHIDVRDGTQVRGDVVLAGGQLSFDGMVDGDFIAAGGDVELAGEIGGNANIRSSSIKIAPGTAIAGNLTYSSPDELTLAPDVTVAGAITREVWEGDDSRFLDDIGVGGIIAIATAAI
ncbi:MAG: hypothetical protein RLN70_01675, partial [Rhodospirillaceae bacterium]